MPSPSDNPTRPVKLDLKAPSGTRDLYPIELARRRWIEDKWRKTAIRHGFDEIDGPTFEATELYTMKSGDGIVGEIFGVYSGKDEASVKTMGERLAAGERGAIAPYALRPEFTPTLARMYAARAGNMAKPTKWFWQQNCFRAERQQRGRLREFMQWNCDILGGSSDELATQNVDLDVEAIAVAADFFRDIKLLENGIRIRVNHRPVFDTLIRFFGVSDEHSGAVYSVVDGFGKVPFEKSLGRLLEAGIAPETAQFVLEWVQRRSNANHTWSDVCEQLLPHHRRVHSGDLEMLNPLRLLHQGLNENGLGDFASIDPTIVRGLAYYTGTVFEIQHGGERAVAGGGRYDNLIETFGGPPTPAVGFGMGDVVLSLVLQDKGLMPSDKQIAADLGLRPDVFVISNGQPESDALVAKTIADLRARGMHVRRSYKATKNIGKILKDANDANARYAVIIESGTEITLKNLDDNTQDKGPRAELLARIVAKS